MKVEAAIPYCHQLEMKEMFEKDALLQMAKRGDWYENVNQEWSFFYSVTPDFFQFSQLKYIILLLFFRFFRSIIFVIFQAFWFTLKQVTYENIYNSYNALSLWFISL